MQLLYVVLICLALTTTLAEPEPKKYKNASNEKDKKHESLTSDERKFLREVEEKFGVKSDVPVEENKEEKKKGEKSDKDAPVQLQKPPFPAVIAIEIVNDTDTQSKGKRTIDANLGYGYRTDNGYSYTYFGKSNQDKGKFMIYPYSQEDIPAKNYQGGKYSSLSNGHSQSTNVEIQPSQAYELVPVKNEQTSYDYKKPAIEFKTGYEKNLESSFGGYTGGKTSQTLYTTYNGQEFSGLSGQFPTVMPNYFVDPTQLLNNPHYQNAGLTQDHLRTQNSYLNENKRIVPVLVLRVPSSYLKNPTAELYPDLPKNYPLAQHLNSVNLQELVNQYFKKNGFSVAPQIMSYQSPSVATPESEPQHYSNPYIKPTYTQADYSGIQYSAVKPVMARYPLTYNQQKYLVSQPQSLYQRPMPQQYQYEYKYMPHTEVKMRTYYIQPQYQYSSQAASANEYQNEQPAVQYQASSGDTASQEEYSAPQYSSGQQSKDNSVEYESQNEAQPTPQPDVSQYVSANPETTNYDSPKESVEYSQQSVSQDYNSASVPEYSSLADYYTTKNEQKSSVSIVPSNLIHTEQYQENTGTNAPQEYVYQGRSNEDGKSYVLSENYPSKDHTIATVLPYSYQQAKKPIPQAVQTVSYVTPVPSAKYQSQYKIMVPQTVLRNPEKVSYVNSQSVPMHYTQASHYATSHSESDYTGSQYISPVASKPSYTRNYYSHAKRMVKPDSKPEGSSIKIVSRKPSHRNEKKKSS